MSLFDKLLGRVSSADKKKLEDSEDYVRRTTAVSLRKQRDDGKINNDQFNQKFNQQFTVPNQQSTPKLGLLDRANLRAANWTANNGAARPILTGAAALSPTNTVGNVAAYGGRVGGALGWNKGKFLAEAGDQMANWTKPNQDFANRGMRDSLISGGIGLAGDIVNSLNPITQAATTAKYFTSSANNLASNMEKTGYSPRASIAAGTALGGVTAGLERLGLNKITGGKSGAITSKLANKLPSALAKNGLAKAGGRLLASGVTEGTTEGLQQLAENIAVKSTYNKDLSLGTGVKDAAIAGGILGGAARGTLELQGRYGGGDGKAQFKSDIKNVGNTSTRIAESNLPTNMRLTAEKLTELSDYGDYVAGRYKPKGDELNYLIDSARATAKNAGINVTSGSANQINDRIASFLDTRQKTLKAMTEGGFIAGPLAGDFSKAQKAGRVFEGVDGKPRFEVDDSGAKLNNEKFNWGLKMDGKPRKVGDILEHDKMFEQYPELKDVNVRYEPNDLPGHDAHFDPATNAIVITKSRADKSHLSDIVHELQHSIQEKEGFAGGGAPEYRSYASENASIKRGLQDVNTTLNGKNLTADQTQRLRTRRNNLIEQLEQTQDQYGNVYTKAKDIAEYRNLAGEAEARAVQKRMNMTDGERYKRGLEYDMETGGFGSFKDGTKLPVIADNLKAAKIKAAKYGKKHDILVKDVSGTGRPTSIYKSTFYDSLDVPKKDLIIRSGSGKAMYIDLKSKSAKEAAYGLSEEQATFVNDYANMLEDMDSNKDGGMLIPDGEQYGGGYKQASTHGTFYKDTFAEKGRAPTKAEWFGEAQNQIKSGNAAFGASEDFRQIQGISNTAQSQPKPSVVLNRSQLSGRALDIPSKPAIDQADFDSLVQQDPTFNAVASKAGSNSAKKLETAINTDSTIQNAEVTARDTGDEFNFFARKDSNGRSVGIETFDPSSQTIQAGYVIDRNGNNLGNHVKVDNTGIQVNVGGELVNMNQVIGNPLDWRGKYKVTSDMERNIMETAPDKVTGKKTIEFSIVAKTKAEANLKTELSQEYKNLGTRMKEVMAFADGDKKKFKTDIFNLLDGKQTDADIKGKYGKEAGAAFISYKTKTRQLYDSLLDRVNETRIKFGQEPIPKRKDYITHLQEMSNSKKFVGELISGLKNSITEEGKQTTRGGVPMGIEGRTENFKPVSAFNKFYLKRKGDKALKDPFLAVQAYLEPALYNIHMTESIVRARAIESAFRTAGELKTLSEDKALSEMSTTLKQYGGMADNTKLTAGFQEYANALSKKTQRWDRQIIDASDASAKGLKGWQKLQKISGEATILGNASSVVSQTLGIPVALADSGGKNFMKGITATLKGDKAIEKSPFITARKTHLVEPVRSKAQIVKDAGGVPLQAVEEKMIELTWYSQHAKAKKAGYSGMQAITEADMNTKRLVAGRGIADKPEIYRSTATGGLLQYTLEQNAQNKAFWKDFTPKQKATFLVTTMAFNSIIGAVTGREPLPDPLGATLHTAGDFMNEQDDRSGLQKTVNGVQRAASTFASSNPAASAVANSVPKSTRSLVFGKDSPQGIYEGTAAPLQMVNNVISAAGSASKGQLKNARNKLMKTLPFGNQAQKTLQGVEMIKRGYGVNTKGEPTFAAPDNPIEMTKGLLFGPNAVSNSNAYYDNKNGTSSGSPFIRAIKGGKSEPKDVTPTNVAFQNTSGAGGGLTGSASAATASSMPSMTKVKGVSSSGKSKSVTVPNVIADSFATDEKRKFLMLSGDEKKEYAKTSKEGRKMYDEYNSLTKTFDATSLRPEGLSPESTATLDQYDRRTEVQREKIFNKDTDAEYKYKLAKYESDKLDGKISTKSDDIKRNNELYKLKIASKTPKEIRDIYTLAKGDIYDFITTDPQGDSIAKQLVAYEDELIKAGVGSRKIRDKNGNIVFNPSATKGRGGKGSMPKFANFGLSATTPKVSYGLPSVKRAAMKRGAFAKKTS